ncbi:hypothetical protein [Scytonema sp. NUACC26]|uniref:hypothetical protein n=1 Tax=Scytonema sp. NUACC26 TaxID=3140176 RepID=UPI0034DC1426
MAPKRGNPKIKEHSFQPEGEKPLSKPFTVKLTETMYNEVKGQDNPGKFVRDAIQEKLDKQKNSSNDT